MTHLDPRLLKDLSRLAQRYPPEQWSLLAAWVNDDRNQRKVAYVLQELAEASRSARQRPSSRAASSRAEAIRRTIKEMQGEDPERAAALEGLWDKLRARELLRTMAAMRSFVAHAGLGDLGSSRRDQAVTELMEQLVALPRDEIDRIARTPSTDGRDLGEEYERWVRLILDRKSDESPS